MEQRDTKVYQRKVLSGHSQRSPRLHNNNNKPKTAKHGRSSRMAKKEEPEKINLTDMNSTVDNHQPVQKQFMTTTQHPIQGVAQIFGQIDKGRERMARRSSLPIRCSGNRYDVRMEDDLSLPRRPISNVVARQSRQLRRLV